MFCSFCGTVISADQKKCPICGSVNEAPVVTETPAAAPEAAPAVEAATVNSSFGVATNSTPVVTMEEASPYANYAPEVNQYEAEYNRIVADANAPKKEDGTATLVFGIISLVIPMFFGGLLSVASLIMAIIAMKKAKPFKDYPNADGASTASIGKVLAIIGLVLSIINLAVSALAMLFLIGYIVIIFLIMMLPTLMYI